MLDTGLGFKFNGWRFTVYLADACKLVCAVDFQQVRFSSPRGQNCLPVQKPSRMTYNSSINDELKSIKPSQHYHGTLNTTDSVLNTKPADSESTALDVRLSSCDGEEVDSERFDISKSLFFPIPGKIINRCPLMKQAKC